MAMKPDDMADAIHTEMGFPGDASDDLKGWAKAIIMELTTNAVVANAPGTITGDAPPTGGPLINGEGKNGLITKLEEANLADNVSSFTGRSPVTAQLIGFSKGIVDHIMAMGRVEFASGNIIGACTNTPPPPPPGLPGMFTGSGSNGEVTSLDGAQMALLVKDNVGYPDVSPELEAMCTAICNYIMDNAEVIYALCSGTAIAGGGPIVGGFAAAGIIL